jgi:phospholipase/carboxylesterase
VTTPPLHALIAAGPASGPVIVLLHGRGSDERDLFALGRALHPDATTVSVRAPFDAAPWGYGAGYAWYRFLGGVSAEEASFLEGQAALASFLAALPVQLGRPLEPLFLAGFSQGGTSALVFALRHPGAVDGVLVFSGFLSNHESVQPMPSRVVATPIFWGHGTADEMVPFELATSGWRELESAGARLESHRYPRMGHSINPDELRDAARWLQARLEAGNNNGAR